MEDFKNDINTVAIALIRHNADTHNTELSLWLQSLETSFENRILSLDSSVVRVWAQITVHAESQGKPIAAFDSIIAATAKAHDCLLVTRNVRDFANAGIEVLNPWE
jgi:predicted nucleic acid-binding protein